MREGVFVCALMSRSERAVPVFGTRCLGREGMDVAPAYGVTVGRKAVGVGREDQAA